MAIASGQRIPQQSWMSEVKAAAAIRSTLITEQVFPGGHWVVKQRVDDLLLWLKTPFTASDRGLISTAGGWGLLLGPGLPMLYSPDVACWPG